MLSASASRVLALLGAARPALPGERSRFQPAAPHELADFGGLVFTPREPTRRVTSLGVLWHGRRVGCFDGHWALHFEHVLLEAQLDELADRLDGLASIDGLAGWELLEIRPQTREAQGEFVLRIPEARTASYDTAALLLYGALRRDPARQRSR